MKTICPSCNADATVTDETVLSEAARIMGKRSKRKLSHQEASEMGKLGAAKRWKKVNDNKLSEGENNGDD
jgi:hypothetical protein